MALTLVTDAASGWAVPVLVKVWWAAVTSRDSGFESSAAPSVPPA
jgi:hypothetical protein